MYINDIHDKDIFTLFIKVNQYYDRSIGLAFICYKESSLQIYNKMYARLVRINLTLLLRKTCSVHMIVFEIVAHRNDDN